MTSELLPADKPFCVYIYRDPRPSMDRAPIYVGMGDTLRRPNVHWKYCGHNKRLTEVLADIKQAGLAPIVEYIDFFNDRDAAIIAESKVIEQFRHQDTLCNITGVRPPSPRHPVHSLDGMELLSIGPQIRAARALLGWSAMRLSTESGVSYSSIQRAEAAPGIPTTSAQNLFLIQRALELGGVIFIDANTIAGAGVRLRRATDAP